MMTWLTNLTAAQQLVIGLPAMGAAFYSIWRFVLRPIRDFFRRLRATMDHVEEIRGWIGPNGGKSLSDKTNTTSRIARRLEALMSTMFDIIVDRPMFLTDEHGNFTRVNTAFEKVFETTCDRVRGRAWIRLVLPEDRDSVVKEWDFAIKTDERGVDLQGRFVTQGDEPQIALCRLCAEPVIDDGSDKPIGWMGSIEWKAPLEHPRRFGATS